MSKNFGTQARARKILCEDKKEGSGSIGSPQKGLHFEQGEDDFSLQIPMWGLRHCQWSFEENIVLRIMYTF